MKKIRKKINKKFGPHLSCNLHKIRADSYSNLAFAPILCKKVWSWMDGQIGGWMDGWMGGRARLRIAYSNKKQS